MNVLCKRTVLATLIVCLAVSMPHINCAKILLVFPAVSKSHFLVGEALTLGLAEAGHNVTILSAYDYKPKLPNVEAVQLTGVLEMAEGKHIFQIIHSYRHFLAYQCQCV